MRHAKKPQVIVITGASAGIGRATARQFAGEGAKIGLLARNDEALQNAKREVEELGGEGLVLRADVADEHAVENAAQATEDRFGPIDIWVNNAMVSVFSPVREMTFDDYRRVTDVTYLGVVWGTLAALKRMRPRDRGSIVQVGSALAYRGIPLQSAYCAAKHAVQGFCDSLRTELLNEKSNIKLTMVQLPGVNTPQFDWVKTRLPGKPRPVGTVYQPEVAARAIVWAAHHDRRELFVGYPVVQAVLGNRVAPWYADRVLARDGIEGQQEEEPVSPDRPNNLYDPVPGDFGARGRFDEQSWSFSPQLWATTNRSWLALAGAGLAAAATAALLGSRRP